MEEAWVNIDGVIGATNFLAGGANRPAPRASLVLGRANENAIRRDGLTSAASSATAATNPRVNESGGDANGKGNDNIVANTMKQQHNAMASRRSINRPPRINNRAVGSQNGLHLRNGDANSPRRASTKREGNSKGEYSSDLVVVLDMDKCLIRSQFLSDHLGDKYRHVEDRPFSSRSNSTSTSFEHGLNHNEEAIMWSTCDSFRINMPEGNRNVNKRPNLDLFLREITGKFETYIFTAAMEVYAKPVIDRLDPHGDMFRGRLYREHCVHDPATGAYHKDLRNVLRMRKSLVVDDDDPAAANASTHNTSPTTATPPRATKRRIVLVDNNPLSFLPNPSNGILVSSFYDDPKDDTLRAVVELLHELDGSGDVRPVLDDRFGLREAFVRGASPGWIKRNKALRLIAC